MYFMPIDSMTTLDYSSVTVNSYQVDGLTPWAANTQYFLHLVI